MISIIYKRHVENRRNIRQECSFMQQANYQFHWQRFGTLYESKKVCPIHKNRTRFMHSRMNQTGLQEEEKERQERVKTEARRLRERKAVQRKQKSIWRTKTTSTYTALITKLREEFILSLSEICNVIPYPQVVERKKPRKHMAPGKRHAVYKLWMSLMCYTAMANALWVVWKSTQITEQS